ncbi:unnamed protein product [Clonostachys rhizophaga]|uniref:Heterokaryon incompatibility domain-containing protein n=1 Tax=Clonostachys rhizophaga TaxID=160324 RepID=A0A9N9VJX1_9HYPO|nr:unnamed protein product [Clonostachys rhizophaga]
MEKIEHELQAVETPRSTALEAWLADYLRHKADQCDSSSYPVSDVTSDEIDVDAIEMRVKQLMKDIHVTAGFCSRCSHLLQHWPNLSRNIDWDYAVGQTYSTEEVEAASRLGCKLCAFLWTGLNKDNSVSICRKIEARLAALHNPARSALTIQNWGTLNDTENSGSQLLWWNYPGKKATHCNMVGARLFKFESQLLPPETQLWDEPNDPIELAKTWLLNCIESHETCRLKKTSAPSRLVPIANNIVKLVETELWDEMPQYATLSYCWGRIPFVKLTKETLPTFLNEITFESLPKTFQDAIEVARRLGLSFMWIDALCIIQDDEDHSDWRQESGRMKSIYSGSHVTISASSATDVSQGFFPSSSPKYSGGFIAQVQAEEFTRVQNFHSTTVHEDSTVDTHLGGRSWAFQEKLLSPRTIHIGDHGVYWECQTSVKSQFLPEGFPGMLPRSRLVCSEKEEWDWREIVNIYSKTSRTYESDILPALSGIAARQHDITGDKYLAGLWKNDLLSMLPWFTFSPASVVKRPAWRAPTWSWASVEGPCIISYMIADTDLKPQARLLDAWTKTVDDYPFGAVVDGEITLACSSLIMANLNYAGIEKYHHKLHNPEEMLRKKQRPYLTLSGLESNPLPVSIDCLENEMLGKEEGIYLLPLYDGVGGAMRRSEGDSDEEMEVDSEDEAANSDVGEMKAPPSLDSRGSASSKISVGGEWIDELFVTGLVLRPVTDLTGHYTRIGQFSFSNFPNEVVGYQDEDRNFYRETKDFFQSTGEATAKLACIRTDVSDEDPEQKFVISIK